jgi:hypothetical protein
MLPDSLGEHLPMISLILIPYAIGGIPGVLEPGWTYKICNPLFTLQPPCPLKPSIHPPYLPQTLHPSIHPMPDIVIVHAGTTSGSDRLQSYSAVS